MTEFARVFPCDRAAALNAAYDALEAISFVIERANSMRGTLIVSSAADPACGGRIAVSALPANGGALVYVFPGGETDGDWVYALLDEMSALLTRSDGTTQTTGKKSKPTQGERA